MKAAVVVVLVSFLLRGGLVASEPATFSSPATRATLFELFTSEGCSSCPPAEKRLGELKSSADLWKRIVPVAFHVDYWNHLGWPDRFAKANFTERQRRYADAWKGDSVYTPAFVANGSEWRGGTIPAASNETVGVLTVECRDGAHISASFVPAGSSPHNDLTVEVAWLGSDLDSNVTRGENAGRRLHHDFVVLSLATTPMQPGANGYTGSVVLPDDLKTDVPSAIAAWVSHNGAPLQATGGWLSAAK